MEVHSKESKHDIEMKKSVREITLKLSEEELMVKAREAADLRVLKSTIEEEFTRVKSRYKGQIDDADQQTSELLAIVRSGNEKRIVDVEDRFDYTAGIVTTLHAGKEIGQRLMSNEERQIGLEFVDRRAKKEAEREDALHTGGSALAEQDDAPTLGRKKEAREQMGAAASL